MAKKTSDFSFSYKALINDDVLIVECKERASGKVVEHERFDLGVLRSLTFNDQLFGGEKDSPHEFGEWLPLYGLWIHLSARTSSLDGPAKLAGMRDVVDLHLRGRFKQEVERKGGGFSYQIQAVASSQGLTYEQVAKAKAAYSKDEWLTIIRNIGERKIAAEIERLRGEAGKAKPIALDSLLKKKA